MNNNLLALIGAVGFIHRPVTKESEKQIEELEKVIRVRVWDKSSGYA
mgnify:CR=1 FL=1